MWLSLYVYLSLSSPFSSATSSARWSGKQSAKAALKTTSCPFMCSAAAAFLRQEKGRHFSIHLACPTRVRSKIVVRWNHREFSFIPFRDKVKQYSEIRVNYRRKPKGLVRLQFSRLDTPKGPTPMAGKSTRDQKKDTCPNSDLFDSLLCCYRVSLIGNSDKHLAYKSYLDLKQTKGCQN